MHSLAHRHQEATHGKTDGCSEGGESEGAGEYIPLALIHMYMYIYIYYLSLTCAAELVELHCVATIYLSCSCCAQGSNQKPPQTWVECQVTGTNEERTSI